MCMWDHTAQHSLSAAYIQPLKWYETDGDSETEWLNKNIFSLKSRKVENETKSF